MDAEGRPAFCPRCGSEYTFFSTSPALAWQSAEPKMRPVDGRLERICFACSFRTSRWDALSIPMFLLVASVFPLLWMIWSNLIGPFVFLTPSALALGRRIRRLFERSAGRESH